MPRRPATVTQADVARVIRAAKQAGAAAVEIRVGDQTMLVWTGTQDRPMPADPLGQAGTDDEPVP